MSLDVTRHLMHLVKRRDVVITHLLYLVGAAVRVVGVCSTHKELVRREPLDDPDVVVTVHLHEHIQGQR